MNATKENSSLTPAATHTPGPWSFDKAMTGPTDSFAILHDIQCGPDWLQERIATLHFPPSLDSRATAEANARLIASAPELLAALEANLAALMDIHKHARGMWLELIDAGFANKGAKMPFHDRNLAAIEKARSAIARATQG